MNPAHCTLPTPEHPMECCPHCHGDGHWIYVGGPGTYYAQLGTWLPEEYLTPCPACHGTGNASEIEPAEAPAPAPDPDDDRTWGNADLPF